MVVVARLAPLLAVVITSLICHCDSRQLPYPRLKKLVVLSETADPAARTLVVRLEGEQLEGARVKLTASAADCPDDLGHTAEPLAEGPAPRFLLAFSDSVATTLYLCVGAPSKSLFGGEVIKWYHAGKNFSIEPFRTSNSVSGSQPGYRLLQ